MPISVPVPKEYALKYDKENAVDLRRGARGLHRSVHGRVRRRRQGHRLRAGQGDPPGPQPGLRAGRRLPPRLSGRDRHPGGQRRHVGRHPPHPSGESMASGEIEPPASQLKRLLQTNKTELSVVPGGGWRMISMDTSRPPFDDINVRKAVIAGFNRVAAAPAARRRGARPDRPALHPAGHGRLRGVQRRQGPDAEFDWMAHPEGDRALSAEYFKKAGMASGKYEGDDTVLIVGRQRRAGASRSRRSPSSSSTRWASRRSCASSPATRCSRGSATSLSPRSTSARRSAGRRTSPTRRRCSTRRSTARTSSRRSNSNWPELNVPAVNKEIDAAKLVTDPDERAQAWAKVNHDIVAQAPGDPVHVGLPGRASPRRTCVASRTATRPPGTGTSPRSADSPGGDPARRCPVATSRMSPSITARGCCRTRARARAGARSAAA